MDVEARAALVAQFQAYLEEAEPADEAEGEGGVGDLFHLYVELAALRNEVKLESRQVKGALDQFRALFDLVQENQTALRGEAERRRREERERQRESLRPLLLELLEVRDRLLAGQEVLAARRVGALGEWLTGESAWLEGVRQGQALVLNRLERLLAERGVTRLEEVVGRPLDPHRMRAVGVEQRAGRADGEVVTEQRQGFLWQGELLRLAEVTVNRVTERGGEDG